MKVEAMLILKGKQYSEGLWNWTYGGKEIQSPNSCVIFYSKDLQSAIDSFKEEECLSATFKITY